MSIKFSLNIDPKAFKKIQDKFSKKELNSLMDRDLANKVGKQTVSDMKDLISKGISPIRETGRFEAYRGSYAKGIKKKYYGNKKLRPVNLFLSGAFIKSLMHKVKKGLGFGYDVEIGFNSKLSDEKELEHREGKNNQAKRPIIPNNKENIALLIERNLEKLYQKELLPRIKKLLDK